MGKERWGRAHRHNLALQLVGDLVDERRNHPAHRRQTVPFANVYWECFRWDIDDHRYKRRYKRRCYFLAAPARATPGRPEVDNHWERVLKNELLEVLVRDGNRCTHQTSSDPVALFTRRPAKHC